MTISYNLAFLLLFQVLFAVDRALEPPRLFSLPDSRHELKGGKGGAANIVFTSADGGQTWKDISKGLPEPVKDNDGVGRAIFFADANGLYLTAGKGVYHIASNSPAPVWKKEIFPDEHSSISPSKTGLFAYNYAGEISQKTHGTSVWSPVFTNFQQKRVRTVFETTGGTLFIGTDSGLFKSSDRGKTWKHVHVGGWVMKLVESNGVLLATSMSGIIRSTDTGENWASVISEGGVGINVENINGGFSAITFNTQSNTRRMRTSYDGGKTWQPIDVDLPAQLSMASIIQVGKNFLCGHPDGIFRSSDKGKTWKLLFPSVGGKVFNLAVSGNVIYAIPRDGGC